MLALVVVNYNSSALLARNLVEVTGQISDDALVVVVDNLSTAEERMRVSAMCSTTRWHLILMETNAGFGGGVNAGANEAFAAGATEILVLNPDARIDRASVNALGVAIAQDRWTVASPIVREPEGRIWFGGLDLYLADGTIRAHSRRGEHLGEPHVEWLSGACLLIPREVWDLVGGFDEEFFLYWEDIDWSRRVAAHGVTLRIVHEATAIHEEGGTHREARQRSEAKSETYYYHNIRNRMLFATRHLDDVGIRQWRATAVPNAWQVLLRGGRRQFLKPVRPLRAAWRGLRDGRRLARQALDRDHGT